MTNLSMSTLKSKLLQMTPILAQIIIETGHDKDT